MLVQVLLWLLEQVLVMYGCGYVVTGVGTGVVSGVGTGVISGDTGVFGRWLLG